MALTYPLLVNKNLIDGNWVDASNGDSMDVLNPANGEKLGTIPKATEKDTVAAIEAAHKAFPAWAAKTAYERAALLCAWFDLMIQHKEDLALLMTLENGKSLAESRAEIDYGGSFVEWFAEEAKRVYGRTIPSNIAGRDLQTIKQPVGVSAMITPWNFPNSMITRKMAPALAAGCTVVLKPDHRTPYSALALAKLAEQAGFPKGVINIVTGDAAEIGKIFTSHPLVKKISFTGSTHVGKLLTEQCAPTLKKITLELGGNAPFIVFDSVDVSTAADGLLKAKIRNSGQSCVSPNRIYVHERIHDVFVNTLARHLKDLKVSDGREEGAQIGPLIDVKALEKVDRLVRDAVTHGAQVVAGGKPHKLGGGFYEPTILTHVTADMQISIEEIFGPVIAVQKFSSEDEVIRLANDTDFGLASYFYTSDLAQAQRVMKALQYGMVGVNAGVISFVGAPFGGMKQSGVGREGSVEGMDAYLETKYIAVQA